MLLGIGRAMRCHPRLGRVRRRASTPPVGEERRAWSLPAAGRHYFLAGMNVVKSAVPSGARMLRVVIGDFSGPRDRPKNCSIADQEPKNVSSTSSDSGSGSTASTKATAVERHSHTSGRTAHAMKTANDAPAPGSGATATRSGRRSQDGSIEPALHLLVCLRPSRRPRPNDNRHAVLDEQLVACWPDAVPLTIVNWDEVAG